MRDNKGIFFSSYSYKAGSFMPSNSILLINSNKFSVKMFKWRQKKISPAVERKFNK